MGAVPGGRGTRRDVWVFMVGGNPPHAHAFFEAAVRAAASARARGQPPGTPTRSPASPTPFLHVAHCDLRALLSHDACAGVATGRRGHHGRGPDERWRRSSCRAAGTSTNAASGLAAKNVVAEISVGAFRASPRRPRRWQKRRKSLKKEGKSTLSKPEATKRVRSAFVGEARAGRRARPRAARVVVVESIGARGDFTNFYVKNTVPGNRAFGLARLASRTDAHARVRVSRRPDALRGSFREPVPQGRGVRGVRGIRGVRIRKKIIRRFARVVALVRARRSLCSARA